MSLLNVPEYRTAESVSPRHPDKICDQVSDAILDAYLQQDPAARVAIDVAGGHGTLFVTGEVTSSAHGIDIEAIARRVIGRSSIETVIVQVAKQSGEIAKGVDAGGAGDQGIMIGYATNETPELLPLEVVLARRLNMYLYKRWPYDGKTQVTLRNGYVESIVASFQNTLHHELQDAVAVWLKQQYVQRGVGDSRESARLHINPAGDWQQGGFDSDAGLTGRKLAVDNYGPRIPIGGGAFSGKDASKVDRSAAYMARRIAVDYLRERKANEVTVRLAYAIGYSQPLEASVVIDDRYEKVQGYDLTPPGIIAALDLQRPQYEQTAKYGHFGHGFAWEV